MPRVPQDWKEVELAVSKLIAQSWIDAEFRNRFLEQPKVVLEEAGIVLESFVQVQFNEAPDAVPVLRGTADGNVVYEIPLPLKPEGLSDEKIQVALKDTSTEVESMLCFCVMCRRASSSSC